MENKSSLEIASAIIAFGKTITSDTELLRKCMALAYDAIVADARAVPQSAHPPTS